MNTKKRYELLASLPSYGPMYIPVTDNGKPFYSEGVAVHFTKTDGAEWVGNFEPGFTNLKQVIEFETSQNVLVIACGTCYLMNPDITSPIEVFGMGYCAIFKASKGRYVLQDQTDLTIIEPDGTHWSTERLALDDLSEIHVENNLVSGLAYDLMHGEWEWTGFQYDLDTKTLISG